MAELTLISKHQQSLKPLVEAALANELRLLESGISRNEQRLQAFETKYQLPTTEFIRQFEADELEETLELAEWVGEFRLLVRLQERAEILRGVEFANGTGSHVNNGC